MTASVHPPRDDTLPKRDVPPPVRAPRRSTRASGRVLPATRGQWVDHHCRAPVLRRGAGIRRQRRSGHCREPWSAHLAVPRRICSQARPVAPWYRKTGPRASRSAHARESNVAIGNRRSFRPTTLNSEEWQPDVPLEVIMRRVGGQLPRRCGVSHQSLACIVLIRVIEEQKPECIYCVEAQVGIVFLITQPRRHHCKRAGCFLG